VSELVRSVSFYRDVIGLTVLARDGKLAQLGLAGSVLLELEEIPGVQPIGRRTRWACITPHFCCRAGARWAAS